MILIAFCGSCEKLCGKFDGVEDVIFFGVGTKFVEGLAFLEY